MSKRAKAKTVSSVIVKQNGVLSLASLRHSKNPSAGMRQRRFLRDSRNAGLEATVSLRALMSLYPMLASFDQNGMRPQRIRDRDNPRQGARGAGRAKEGIGDCGAQ